MSKNNRVEWIDGIRGLAIMCVVLCHAVETIYSLNLDGVSAISFPSKVFAFGAFTIGRLGVPFFLFITGYLLLDRSYDSSQCIKFWKKKWLGMVVTIECWIIIYNLFLTLYGGQSFYISNLIKEMLFVKSVNMNHMWYMPMILGMYVFIPIVANALEKMELRIFKFPILIIFAYAFLVPLLNVVLTVLTSEGITRIFSLGFSGGECGFYIILGYIVKRGVFKKADSKMLAAVGAISFGITVLLQLFSYAHGYAYNVWYDCASLMICGLCIFELASRKEKLACKPLKGIMMSLSKYSFAIYLIHNPIKLAIKEYILLIPINALRVVVIWFAVLMISWGVAIVISKIPKVGKVLLYMR